MTKGELVHMKPTIRIGKPILVSANDRKENHFRPASVRATVPIGQHRLPPLPYAYDALEPYIAEEIMRLHHTVHHQGYVTVSIRRSGRCNKPARAAIIHC